MRTTPINLHMIYLYVTPSGSVNLIEGDKMPVGKRKTCGGKGFCCDWNTPCQSMEYDKQLSAAKASSVPVDDQDAAWRMIFHELPEAKDFKKLKQTVTYRIGNDHYQRALHSNPDFTYGPFDISFEIQSRCCANENLAIGMCERDCEAYESFHKVKGPKEVTILLPEKELCPTCNKGKEFDLCSNSFHFPEPVGKLEEKEEPITFENFFNDFMESYAFVIPYDGSDNFYDEKRLKDAKLKSALKAVFEKYINGGSL